MGAMPDRMQENLGSSDRAILSMRNMLLAATKAVENGQDPRGLNPASYRDARPHDGFVPKDATWQETLKAGLAAKW
jgi:hypothetical protein